MIKFQTLLNTTWLQTNTQRLWIVFHITGQKDPSVSPGEWMDGWTDTDGCHQTPCYAVDKYLYYLSVKLETMTLVYS